MRLILIAAAGLAVAGLVACSPADESREGMTAVDTTPLAPVDGGMAAPMDPTTPATPPTGMNPDETVAPDGTMPSDPMDPGATPPITTPDPATPPTQ